MPVMTAPWRVRRSDLFYLICGLVALYAGTVCGADDAQQAFNLFDKKGNGRVMTKDIGSVFKSLGLPVDDEKVKYWTDYLDKEALGYIDFDQFKQIFELKLKEDEDERELKDAFRVLDKNHKGTIGVDDLRWMLKSVGDDLTEEGLDDMIAEADTDGSGAVDYEEFKNLMTPLISFR